MRILFFLLIGAVSFSSCQKNQVTGRSQLMLVSESEVNAMALQEYKSFLSTNPVVTKGSTPEQQMVARVGQRISSAITSYLTQEGKGELIKGYQWEFNLVQSKEVNAWCMPGGKVVVYTGILPVTQNESALAVVMGHEIAHAIALHGNERMSQGLAQQLGGAALSVALSSKPAETQQLFMTAYGVGSNVGVILPFSRKQELEADKFGLIFAAMAGYNPEEAVPFWKRMAGMSQGQKPPELLSTHPSDATRIEKVGEYAKEAMKYYKPGTQSAK